MATMALPTPSCRWLTGAPPRSTACTGQEKMRGHLHPSPWGSLHRDRVTWVPQPWAQRGEHSA